MNKRKIAWNFVLCSNLGLLGFSTGSVQGPPFPVHRGCIPLGTLFHRPPERPAGWNEAYGPEFRQFPRRKSLAETCSSLCNFPSLDRLLRPTCIMTRRAHRNERSGPREAQSIGVPCFSLHFDAEAMGVGIPPLAPPTLDRTLTSHHRFPSPSSPMYHFSITPMSHGTTRLLW